MIRSRSMIRLLLLALHVFGDSGRGRADAPPESVEEVPFNQQGKDLIKTPGVQVWALAFAPDGKVLGAVTGTEGSSQSGPGELLLYDVAGRTMLATVKEPAGLRTLAFAPDGETLATSGFDNTVKVREAATGAVRATLGAFGSLVSAVAFAPDGKTLVTGCVDASVKLWDTTSGREVRALPGHGNRRQRRGDRARRHVAGRGRQRPDCEALGHGLGRAPVHASRAGTEGRVRGVCARRTDPCVGRRRRPRPALGPGVRELARHAETRAPDARPRLHPRRQDAGHRRPGRKDRALGRGRSSLADDVPGPWVAG